LSIKSFETIFNNRNVEIKKFCVHLFVNKLQRLECENEIQLRVSTEDGRLTIENYGFLLILLKCQINLVKNSNDIKLN